MALGGRNTRPIGTVLSGVTNVGSGDRVIPVVARVTRVNVNACFRDCMCTSPGGDSLGVFRVKRNNVGLNRGRCCLSASDVARGVHRRCGLCVNGLFRLTNFSRTSTRRGITSIVRLRATVTGISHDTARLHSPRTGCRGVSFSRLGGAVTKVS